MFCREAVEELRQAAESAPGYPEILFFHQGTVDQGKQFFDGFWPEARAVSDPDRMFFDELQVKAASLRKLFGPGVWLRALQAARKGHSVGRPVGSPWTMPGTFLVRAGCILWSHRFDHVADHPDFEAMPERVADADSAASCPRCSD